MTRTMILVAALGLLALALGLVIAPRTPRLGSETTGDAALAAQVRSLVPKSRGFQTLHVAVVSADGVRYAGIGALDGRTPDETTPFELGSITKTFDGLLLADAVRRGEVAATDRLGDCLPRLAGTRVGEATLEELASHRAGVPPLPPSVLAKVVPAMITGANPYALETDSLLAQVATIDLMKTRGTVVYSNLGATLLGHALASRALASDWRSYVSERLLVPLGMTGTTFAANRRDVPSETIPGRTSDGRRVAPWTSEAFAPAGAASWTTASDMARYAQAILAGRAPGMDAMAPRWDAGDGQQIGYAWFTRVDDGRDVTWHNGGTSGYRTMLAIDRSAGRAVLAVSSTTREVDALALELLKSEPGPVGGPPTPWVGLVLLVIALVVISWAGVALLQGADRLGIVAHAAELVGLLSLSRALGPWSIVPGWTWGLLLAGGVTVLVVGLTRLKPASVAPKRRWWRWLSSALTVLVGVLFTALTIT